MAKEQTTYRAANDAYTGMLIISLIALIAGGTLLFLDYQQYPEANPKGPPTKAPVIEIKAPEKQPEVKVDPNPDENKDANPDEKKGEQKKDDAK